MMLLSFIASPCILFFFLHANALKANSTFNEQHQSVLSKVINATLKLNGVKYQEPPESDFGEKYQEQSAIEQLCDMLPVSKDKSRAACCLIDDGGVLLNAKVGEKTVVRNRKTMEHAIGLFRESIASTDNSSRRNTSTLESKASFEKRAIFEPFWRTPRIGLGGRDRFGSPSFSIIGNRMNKASCPNGVFKGTLHVTGQKTLHVVYHTIIDNYAPIVSQILMDAHANSRFLHLPRIAVLLHPLLEHLPKSSKVTTHVKLIEQLFAAGTYTSLSSVAGMCFERVIWGWGANSVYYQYLTTIRRQVADFARFHLEHFYNLPVPQAFAPIALPVSMPVEVLPKKLNVVYFTRGNSSEGRSMQNEQLITEALNDSGWANAQLCCDYQKPDSFSEQLALAYHADVVIGLHGAGLTHALFSHRGSVLVELKTEYAYESVLFNMIADARVGMHAQVSVTPYQRKGGLIPVDAALVAAVVQVTRIATRLEPTSATNKLMFSKLAIGQYNANARTRKGGRENWLDIGPPVPPRVSHGLQYALNGPMNASEAAELAHFLGPAKKHAFNICIQQVINKYEEQLHEDRGRGGRGDRMSPQCLVCTKYFD